MGKYIYLYRGSAAELSELSPEQGAERMEAFRAWMTRVGTALVDVGCPFGTSTSVLRRQHRGSRQQLHRLDLDGAQDVPTLPLEAEPTAVREDLNTARPKGGGHSRSTAST